MNITITIALVAALSGLTILAFAASSKITEIKRADRNKIESWYHRGY